MIVFVVVVVIVAAKAATYRRVDSARVAEAKRYEPLVVRAERCNNRLV